MLRNTAMLRKLLPLAILAAAAALIALLFATRPSMAPVDQSETVWVVETQTVRFDDRRPVLTLLRVLS